LLPVWASVKQFSNDINPPLALVNPNTSAIVLTALSRGNTYLITSAGPASQAISQSGLTSSDAGFYVVLHNGNGTGGGDITITGLASGTAIIHNRTATQNGGDLYVYWNGTQLIGY
jgi:hypothetical protein